jgi:hypothetical protein
MTYRKWLLLTCLLSLCSVGCRSAGAPARPVNAQGNQQGGHNSAPVGRAGPKGVPTQEEIARDALRQGYKVHRQQYSNYEYGYTVLIPSGLVGVSNPSPGPQHGFEIVLSKRPAAGIRVDGSYDADLYGSLEEAAEARLRWLKRDNNLTEIEVLRSEQATLQNLQAVRQAVRFSEPGSGEKMVLDFVAAIRIENEGGDEETRVLYTISLSTPESRYRDDQEILEQVITSWRAKPLGE